MSGKLKTRTRYMLVGSDYSAQEWPEPRLTAYLSQDKKMIEAYQTGRDLYAVIAQSAFNNNYEDNLEFYPEGTELEIDGKKIICGHKTHLNKAGKERRSVGKTLQLASCYGMSGATAGAKMGKTKAEGEALLESFFGQFTGVKKAIDDSKESLKQVGYVEDWAGRRRHLPDYFLPPYEVKYIDESKMEFKNFNPFLLCADKELDDSKISYYKEQCKKLRGNKEYDALKAQAKKDGILIIANTGRISQAERQCFNARIQGGASSLTKLAMINIYNDKILNEHDAHLVITVHDEVLVECPALYADIVEKQLPKVMVDTAANVGINVPMQCDPYCVSHWYEDEAAVSVREEFKKLEKGNEDEGIPPLDRESAFEKVVEDHQEYLRDELKSIIFENN